MGDRRDSSKVLVGRPGGERDDLDDLGVDGRIILKLIFSTLDGG
jgi:hypothetical protein